MLGIFENKIRNSEIQAEGSYTEDVWGVYFPKNIGGREFRKYLLDSGLHRPRGVLLRIIAAVDSAYGRSSFCELDFVNSEDRFGELMLEEFSEEISATYDEHGREAIYSLLRGNHYAFTREQMLTRISDLSGTNKHVKSLRDNIGVDNLLRLLFRIGMIGNNFSIEETGQKRQVWAFRGASDPLLEKRFVLHQSVRKVLATV